MNLREDLREVEQTIRDYYFHISKIEGYYNKVKVLEKQIEDLKRSLKANDFTLDTDLRGIPLEDKVQSSRISSLDNRLIKAYEEVEKELKRKQIDVLDNKVKIMKIEEDISLISSFINDLTEDERKLLEKTYKEKIGGTMASVELNMSRTSWHIKRSRILQELKNKYIM